MSARRRTSSKRIIAYTRPTGYDTRIERMIAATAAIEFVSTATETEALLLEANLIKRLRPRFNVLLRDDKSFPYILITARSLGAADPQASRRAHPQGRLLRPVRLGLGGQPHHHCAAAGVPAALLLGQRLREPHAAVPAAPDQALLGALHAARSTSRTTASSCARPTRSCRARAGRCSEQLGGRDGGGLRRRSNSSAPRVYRDRLAALSAMQSHQGINPRGVEEADVFAVASGRRPTASQVFFFRTGQNWGNRAYFPKADRSLAAGEVLGAFLAQFYDDKPVPALILVSHEIEERELLAEALGDQEPATRSRSACRSAARRSDLVDHALANAREALGRKLAESSSQAQAARRRSPRRFGLPRTPRRIEVYDNSHILGTNAVGAMIVAGPEGFQKNQYRKFNIRRADLTPGDDFGMMREVLSRRFKRLMTRGARELADAVAELASAVRWSARIPLPRMRD